MKALLIGAAIAAGALLIGAAASADAPASNTNATPATSDTPPPTTTDKNGYDPNKVVCKQVAVTDSHLPGSRVCMTMAQWDSSSDEEGRSMSDAMRRPGMTGVPGGMSSKH